MQHKSVNFIIQGMQRDLNNARYDQNFAYENMNIRLTAINNKSLLAVTNEKGNLKLTAKDEEDSDFSIVGNYIGHCTVGKYLVLFTHSTTIDNIYKFYFKEDVLYGKLVTSSASLGFNENYPIEAIGIYESENIQKVYWVDGKNPARYINIENSKYEDSSYDSTVFDFTGNIPFPSSFNVVKNSTTTGNFQAGIIQYTYSFYDKNGRESNLVDVSPILYITKSDRGGNAETICTNSFKIEIKGIDNSKYKYDYIRIYSIHRSSYNATPSVRNVIDIKLNYSSEYQDIEYVDTGYYGTPIDAFELLFKGGEELIPNTLVQKDGTLFLGNFKTTSNVVDEELKSLLKESTITFDSKLAELLPDDKSKYSYKFQLNNPSSYITTFKQGETYRFGLQLQSATGKWSEVVYIGDAEVPYILQSSGEYAKLICPNITLTTEAVTKLKASKYVKIRGTVVFPSAQDKTIVAQGILCPTVFNLSSRFYGNIYAQSSWFARPFSSELMSTANTSHDFTEGAALEFRHEYLVPNSNGKFNMEIGVVPSMGENIPTNPWGEDVKEYYLSENSLFYVDQNVVTFHSPEIAFSDTILTDENLKLRIVGIVPLTAFSSKVSINLESSGYFSVTKDYISAGVDNNSILGYRSLASGFFFYDHSYESDEDVDGGDGKDFLVFPWHRNGSLNNFPKTSGTQARNAVLKNKKMSNLKYSNSSIYFNGTNAQQWEAYIFGSETNTGITPVNTFIENSDTIVKIKRPTNSGLNDLIYSGNVDTILTGRNKIFVKGGTSGIEEFNDGNEHSDPVSMKYKSTSHAVFALNYTNDGKMRVLPVFRERDKTIRTNSPAWIKSNDELIGYDLAGYESIDGTYDYEIFSLYEKPDVNSPDFTDGMYYFDRNFWRYDYTAGWRKISNIEDGSIIKYESELEGILYFTTTKVYNVSLDLSYDRIDIDDDHGVLYLAELYRDIDDSNRFGGTSELALENNVWQPAGKSEFISNLSNSNAIKCTEGDTYYQRYDCLKTYAYTNEDQNSVVEIVSFMCETNINIEGRWDRNRGQINNLNMSPTNFNLFNPVYNQTNNFFTYRILSDDFNQVDYPTSIVWSLNKTLGERIDQWTKFNLTSLLDLDGNNGRLQKLQLLNNEIFSFQDKGIAKILFNSRVQIPTSEGVPIEIANSGKVDGKVYLTQEIGTINKWSIITTPNGTYFIDNNNFGIYNLSNGLVCISDKLNMSSVIKEHASMESWNPKDFSNFRCFYDRINSDVYFVNKDICLCFNELLGQFTSFYNYESTPMMCNIEDRFISFKDSNLWEFFAGDYNSFYDEIKPFYITYIANPEPTKDKIFNVLEFRSDTYFEDTLLNRTFDTLEVWNEYQRGKSKLANITGATSNLKRKFRVWRAQIPRHNNSLQRIRNPWCYIKLSMDNPSNYKTILYDTTLSYSV